MRFLLIFFSSRLWVYCRKIIVACGRSRSYEWSRRDSINTHKYSNITLAPSVSRTVSHMTTRFVVPKMPLLRTACSSAACVANGVEEDSSLETRSRKKYASLAGAREKDNIVNTDNTVLIFVESRLCRRDDAIISPGLYGRWS